MGTTREDIAGWIDEGKRAGATHLIVICDTLEYDDYPVFVLPGQDARTTFARYDGQNMQRVMEVYDLRIDTDEQLKEKRSFHL